MEKQISLNDLDHIDLEFNRNKFIILGKKEQAEFMSKKLEFILKQCEEIAQKFSDEKNLLTQPKH